METESLLIIHPLSIFKNIGFELDSQEDYKSFLNYILKHDAALLIAEHEEGSYWCFYDESGAEIWFISDASGQIIGFQPFFYSDCRVPISLFEQRANHNTPLEGVYKGMVNPDDLDVFDKGDYPIVFLVPDFLKDKKRTLPTFAYARWIGFAHQVEHIKKEAPKAGDLSYLGKETFLHLGILLERAKGDQMIPSSLISGEILSIKRLTNSQTQNVYYCVRLTTLGSQIDILFPEEMHPKNSELEPGDYISSHILLSARLEYPNPLSEEMYMLLREEISGLSFKKSFPVIEMEVSKYYQQVFESIKNSVPIRSFPGSQRQDKQQLLLTLKTILSDIKYQN